METKFKIGQTVWFIGKLSEQPEQESIVAISTHENSVNKHWNKVDYHFNATKDEFHTYNEKQVFESMEELKTHLFHSN